jgi:hypothetical protein
VEKQETRWVVYVFENGCFVEEQADDPVWRPELGDWNRPFPGTSPASGLEDSFWQSDRYPAHEAWGDLVRVIVSRTEPRVTFEEVTTS